VCLVTLLVYGRVNGRSNIIWEDPKLKLRGQLCAVVIVLRPSLPV
jgi:hypothetical protein